MTDKHTTAPIDRTKAPATKPFGALSLPDPEFETLPNGVRLYTLDRGDQPVNRITISWPVGLFDTDAPSAMVLMSQLLREGAADLSGAQISETLDYNGAWLQAEPLMHNLTVTLYSLNRSVESLLPLLADILMCPTFPEREFATFREKLAAALEVNMQKVAYVASLADKRLVFGANHPAAQKETPDMIRQITLDQVRHIYRRTVAAITPSVYIAGSLADVIEPIKRMLSHLNFGDIDALTRDIRPMSPEPDGSREHPAVEGALQSAVVVSMPTIGRDHPDYIDLRFAIMALGGYFGSRLMHNIREEKGLTYGISAWISGYFEGGVATIQSQTDPRYVDRLIEETFAEIDRLCRQEMDEDEFEAVKKYAMTSLASYLDSPFTMMDLHMTREHSGVPDRYFDKQMQSLARLTPARIKEVMARHILNAPRLVTVAGNAPSAKKS